MKRLRRIIPALLIPVVLSCLLPFQALAAPPRQLMRTSLQETDRKCAGVSGFRVTYTFGPDTVILDGKSAMTWFVTASSSDRMSKEKRGEGKERSGYFIIGGKETTYPETVLFENGFATDEAGNLILSESAMYETLQEIFSQYNMNASTGTVVFHSTSGRTIYLNGEEPEQIAKVDMKEEFRILRDALLNKQTNVSRVVYTKTVERNEVETVGDDYIEVDVTEQTMYMYMDGEIICETPVVTGNMSWGMGTPQGCWHLINRARNAVLIGEDYRTVVNYWMAFTYNGHGIHDSTWRTSGYGGDIYQYDGSHGCVNTPIDKVAFIFEHAYVGMPVLVFY